MLEAAASILVRPARRLHDTVEAQAHEYNDSSHVFLREITAGTRPDLTLHTNGCAPNRHSVDGHKICS
jgi:sarcosine oxidase delta subunit